MNSRTDVFIVGGGPAGLATALALNQKGFRVTVADGAGGPIEKVCGEGILPEGVAALRELGVEISVTEGIPLRGLRFCVGDESAEACFPVEPGLGIRRIVLHRRMIAAAERAGITLLWNSPVTGLGPDGAIICRGDVHRPSWIIAADGGRSRVRRWAGLEATAMRRPRFAFRRHYRVVPWSNFVEVYWAKDCQSYVTPVSRTEVGVVVLSKNFNLRIDDALSQFPALAERLRGATIATVERGSVTGSWTHRKIVKGNVALVGDASGMIDAISGEGLRLAFQHARALADAVASGRAAQYQREHHRLMRRPRWMARFMLALQGSPPLQRRAIRILAREPALFRRLLSIHAGFASPVHLASAGARLGWKLLAEEF